MPLFCITENESSKMHNVFFSFFSLNNKMVQEDYKGDARNRQRSLYGHRQVTTASISVQNK